MSSGDGFSKTICSICYEDLKPITEDLQVIFVCGHVFHELCLQQWFEYSTTKKLSCPVCKQSCNAKNVARLYFQSTGGDTQSKCPSQDTADNDPGKLCVEVYRLETKVSGLSSALDRQKEECKQLSEELHLCKGQVLKEVALRTEAVKQKDIIQETLRLKNSELVQSNAECSILQQKNLALAKELASIKLISDCNLDEEEVVKFASIGNESNTQDAIDVLKKSLVIRNKSYKELMAKCNILGRGEAHSSRKLEKAKEKIEKLKARVKELELAIEEKDNEALRALKSAKKCNSDNGKKAEVNRNTISSVLAELPKEQEKKQLKDYIINLDDDESMDPRNFISKEVNKQDVSIDRINNNTKETHSHSQAIDRSEAEKPNSFHEMPSRGPISDHGVKKEVGNGGGNRPSPGYSTLTYVASQAHVKQEASSPVLIAEPGERCFVGGLRGPNGANTYLGKWCKRTQNSNRSGLSFKGSNNGGSLISVGADGRGGTVKILRSASQFSQQGQENGGYVAKRYKAGSQTGSLQLEHFFGRTG